MANMSLCNNDNFFESQESRGGPRKPHCDSQLSKLTNTISDSACGPASQTTLSNIIQTSWRPKDYLKHVMEYGSTTSNKL